LLFGKHGGEVSSVPSGHLRTPQAL
jgi:hypothetical protein